MQPGLVHVLSGGAPSFLMVFGVQALLAFNTAQRRNTIQNAITTRISGKGRFGADRLTGTANRVGPNGLAVELRFVTKLDADDLQAFIEAQATGQNTPLDGSWLRVHECSHDEGTNVCTPLFERVWP